MRRRAALLLAILAALPACRLVPNPEAVKADDLAGARTAFLANIAAIHHRNAAEYLSFYLQTPDLTVASGDSVLQGYDAFAAARNANNDWPDTLIAGDPKLVWISPGVVYGAYPYVVVTKGDTGRGYSERVLVKTAKGWKIAVTSIIKR